MPKTRDKEKLNKILDAALKLFSQQGFLNTRIEQIAAEANIATGTVYIYVKNKDEILEKLFDRFYNYYKKKLEEKINRKKTEDQKLDELIKMDVNVLFENEERIKLFLVELRQSPYALIHIKKKILEHYQHFLPLIYGKNFNNIDLISIIIGGIIENFAYYAWLAEDKKTTKIISLHNQLNVIIKNMISTIKNELNN
ncbi:MAG: hypothetical protein Kow00108_07720 [Calditrichia bacterium]